MARFALVIFCMALTCISTTFAAVPDATCKEFVGTLTKKQLGGISSCSKTMKFKNPKDKASKMNCILKCVLINEKLLDANGQMVDDVKFQEFLDNLIPGNLMELAGPKMTICKKTAVTFDGSDEFCKSYDPLIKCMLDVIGNLCKGVA